LPSAILFFRAVNENPAPLWSRFSFHTGPYKRASQRLTGGGITSGDPFFPLQWMKTPRPCGRVFHFTPVLTSVLRSAWRPGVKWNNPLLRSGLFSSSSGAGGIRTLVQTWD